MPTLFSQRHYRKIAAFVKEMEYYSITRLHLRDKLIEMFERDNPKFDKDKFVKACGVIERLKLGRGTQQGD